MHRLLNYKFAQVFVKEPGLYPTLDPKLTFLRLQGRF